MIDKLKSDLEYLQGRNASVEVACAFLIEHFLEKDEIENQLVPLFQEITANMSSSRATQGFRDGVEILIKGTR